MICHSRDGSVDSKSHGGDKPETMAVKWASSILILPYPTYFVLALLRFFFEGILARFRISCKNWNADV